MAYIQNTKYMTNEELVSEYERLNDLILKMRKHRAIRKDQRANAINSRQVVFSEILLRDIGTFDLSEFN